MQSVVRTSLCLSLLASFDNGSKTFVLCVLRTKGFHLPCKPSPTPIPSLRLVAVLLFLFISLHYRLNPAAGGSVLSGFFFSEWPFANLGLASAREAARQRLQQCLRCAAADCLAKHFFGLQESSAFSESCKSLPHGHDSSSRCTVSRTERTTR